MGIPWLGGPIHLHAWRMYMCDLPTQAECDYQSGYWRFWYEADHRYALPTIAFFLSTIIVFSIGYLATTLLPRRLLQLRYITRKTATLRYLSYRSLRLDSLNWNSAPIGLLLLASIGLIFFLSMTLGPKPYYWPNTAAINYGNSPPLATRSGWMALACLPFVFSTAGKSNFISLVTGVSHEKLQVFHRWIAYAFFVLSLVHTSPFIVYNIHTGTMREQWDTNIFYWTGVIALVAQGWLTCASMGPLRHWSYEFFKFSHFLAALIFVLFLFFHCDYTLSSWDYFIATGVLFTTSFLHSQSRIYLQHGIHHATLTLTPNNFIRVSVPTKATWRVGQHFFVRFLALGLHAASSHPFTACTLPSRESRDSELVFYIRPQSGFTARLAAFVRAAQGQGRVRVLLDGPYGGVEMRKIEDCERMLVIAGGSGAGWTLPFAEAFLRKVQLVGGAGRKLSLRIVLATRQLKTKEWFEQEVERLVEDVDGSKAHGIEIEVHYTGRIDDAQETDSKAQPSKSSEKAADIEQGTVNSRSLPSTSSKEKLRSIKAQHFDSRPNLASIIRGEAASLDKATSLGVFVCGPLVMQSDVSNAVAQEQLKIMRSGDGDIYLHMEHFSWA